MVSAMDRSLGRLLDALKFMNIEKNTLVVFTSDNGPEVIVNMPIRCLIVRMSALKSELCMISLVRMEQEPLGDFVRESALYLKEGYEFQQFFRYC